MKMNKGYVIGITGTRYINIVSDKKPYVQSENTFNAKLSFI